MGTADTPKSRRKIFQLTGNQIYLMRGFPVSADASVKIISFNLSAQETSFGRCIQKTQINHFRNWRKLIDASVSKFHFQCAVFVTDG
jgi:hypothetical protein